jgi:hypothetical protein
LKGELRELVACGLLRPFLAPRYGIGGGEVVSAYNDHSPQADIVIYDRSIVPPSLVGDHLGLFPIEATIAVVEVKSKLTATELQDAHDKAVKIQALPFCPAISGESFTPLAPLNALFAFDSDLTESSELERYLRIDGSATSGLVQLCVVGRGNWFRTESGWAKVDCGGDFGEVLSFLATLFNRLPFFAETRRTPNLLAGC